MDRLGLGALGRQLADGRGVRAALATLVASTIAASAGAAPLTTDGVQVTDTTTAPYRSIVYLESRDARDDRATVCTGAFIGQNVVLTAASCLYRMGTSGGYVADVVVTPRRNGGARPYGRQHAVAWEVPSEYRARNPDDHRYQLAQFDVGVVTLPDGSLGRAVGSFSLSESATSPTDRKVLAGYDVFQPPATMWRYEAATDYDDPTIVAIEGAAGMSGGAPIWRASDRALVGVTRAGGPGGTFGGGRRVDAWVRSFVETTCRTLNCVVSTATAAVSSSPAKVGSVTVGPPAVRRVFVPGP